MSVYPLNPVKGNSKLQTPSRTLNTEEYVSRFSKLYLTAELGLKYRLHATHAHTQDDYLSYEIKCPDCGKLMSPVGAPIDCFELGLYACKHCGNR